MARVYTIVTIKTLFGESSGCAYPGCKEPLIFRDRGAATVVAEVAHIRSESVDGPRFDAGFVGDINGPENLILLCGKHHRPVDRHEAVYSVDELLSWKKAQRETAGGGISLSEVDLRRFAGLRGEDRAILHQVARKAQGVVSEMSAARGEVETLRAVHEQARLSAWARMGPMWGVENDGTRHLLGNEGFKLAGNEIRQQQAEISAIVKPHEIAVRSASADLAAELAVVRMIFGPGQIAETTKLIEAAVSAISSDGPSFQAAVTALESLVLELWRLANGDL